MTQMLIRMQDTLKHKLSSVARREGKSSSEVVRDLIEGYVKEHDISTHIGELWKRVGEDMQQNGFTAVDVPRVIREVRRSRAGV